MSDVEGRVWSAVAKATHAMPNRDTVSYEEWLATGDALASEAADDILRTIRQELLSDAAVGAGYRNLTHLHPWGVRDAIAAALDAAGIMEGNDDDTR